MYDIHAGFEFAGINPDAKVSLRDYGFVCRQEKADQYMCIYRVSPDVYDYSFLCESDIVDLFNERGWFTDEQKNEFFSKIAQTQEQFLSLPFMHKAFALIQHFDVEEIMGECFDPMTLKDAEYMMSND